MRGANYLDVEQGSPEWFAARKGCVTGSHIADVVMKRKRGEGELAVRHNYKMQLVAERLSGLTTTTFVSSDMEWGTKTEPLARAAYEINRDTAVDRIGFVYHPTIKWAGASPDGLIGDLGLCEIKCPKTETHLEYILADIVPVEYRPQMYWQMECCEREYDDFISYDPRLPENLQLFVCRLERDADIQAEMRSEVEKFLSEVEDIIKSLPTKKGVSPLEHQLAASLCITEHDIRSAL